MTPATHRHEKKQSARLTVWHMPVLTRSSQEPGYRLEPRSRTSESLNGRSTVALTVASYGPKRMGHASKFGALVRSLSWWQMPCLPHGPRTSVAWR
jgi:hypothetical protein